MKKKFFVWVSLILSVIFITSCSKKWNNKKDILEGDLNLLAHDVDYKYLSVMAEKFREFHPKVNINIQEIEKNYFKKDFEDFLKNPDSSTDMVVMPSEYVTYFGSKYPLSFSEVNEFISSYKDLMSKGRVEDITLGDKIMAFPFDNEAVIIYYNKSLLDAAGINIEDIRTWDNIITLDEKINKSTNNKLIAYTGRDYFDFYNMMLKQLKVDLDKLPDKNATKAMALLKHLFSQNIVDIIEEEKATELLIKGDIPFLIGSNKTLNNIYKKMPSTEKINLGISKIPSFEPGGNRDIIGSGDNFVILEQSKNKSLAKEFIQFAVIEKNNVFQGLNEYYILPSYNKYVDDVAYNTNYSFIYEEKPLRILDYTQRNGTYFKIKPNYLELREEINEEISKIIYSEGNLEKEMENFTNKLPK